MPKPRYEHNDDEHVFLGPVKRQGRSGSIYDIWYSPKQKRVFLRYESGFGYFYSESEDFCVRHDGGSWGEAGEAVQRYLDPSVSPNAKAG